MFLPFSVFLYSADYVRPTVTHDGFAIYLDDLVVDVLWAFADCRVVWGLGGCRGLSGSGWVVG